MEENGRTFNFIFSALYYMNREQAGINLQQSHHSRYRAVWYHSIMVWCSGYDRGLVNRRSTAAFYLLQNNRSKIWASALWLSGRGFRIKCVTVLHRTSLHFLEASILGKNACLDGRGEQSKAPGGKLTVFARVYVLETDSEFNVSSLDIYLEDTWTEWFPQTPSLTNWSSAPQLSSIPKIVHRPMKEVSVLWFPRTQYSSPFI